MGVDLKLDPISERAFKKNLKQLDNYPKEVFRSIVSILFDIRTAAQNRLKENGNIVTGRLRNSLFVKTPNQIHAKRASNALSYSYKGGSEKRSLDVALRGFEGAVGTNVEYASSIENGSAPHKITAKTSRGLRFKIGKQWITKQSVNHPGYSGKSFLGWAVKNTNFEKRFDEARKRIEKKLK